MRYHDRHTLWFKIVAMIVVCLFLWTDIATDAYVAFSPPVKATLSVHLKTKDQAFTGKFDLEILLNVLAQSQTVSEAHSVLSSSKLLREHFGINCSRMFANNIMEVAVLAFEVPDGRVLVRCYDPMKQEPFKATEERKVIKTHTITSRLCVEIIHSGKTIQNIALDLPKHSGPTQSPEVKIEPVESKLDVEDSSKRKPDSEPGRDEKYFAHPKHILWGVLPVVIALIFLAVVAKSCVTSTPALTALDSVIVLLSLLLIRASLYLSDIRIKIGWEPPTWLKDEEIKKHQGFSNLLPSSQKFAETHAKMHQKYYTRREEKTMWVETRIYFRQFFNIFCRSSRILFFPQFALSFLHINLYSILLKYSIKGFVHSPGVFLEVWNIFNNLPPWMRITIFIIPLIYLSIVYLYCHSYELLEHKAAVKRRLEKILLQEDTSAITEDLRKELTKLVKASRRLGYNRKLPSIINELHQELPKSEQDKLNTALVEIFKDRKHFMNAGGGGINVARALIRWKHTGGVAVVTPNVALDCTIDFRDFFESMHTKEPLPGTKDENIKAFYFYGGPVGKQYNRLLENEGVLTEYGIELKGSENTRANVIIKTGTSDEVGMRLAGPSITPEKAMEMYRSIMKNTSDTDIVVLSGSLPGSLPPAQEGFHRQFFMKILKEPDISQEFKEFYENTIYTENGSSKPFDYFYALLVAQLQKQGRKVCLNTKGKAFKLGLSMQPYLVLQEINEFAATSFRDKTKAENMVKEWQKDVTLLKNAMKVLVEQGVPNVIVTMGPEGALWVTQHGSYWTRPPKLLEQSNISAGDIFMAKAVMMLNEGETVVPLLALGATAAATASVKIEEPESAKREAAKDMVKEIKKIVEETKLCPLDIDRPCGAYSKPEDIKVTSTALSELCENFITPFTQDLLPVKKLKKDKITTMRLHRTEHNDRKHNCIEISSLCNDQSHASVLFADYQNGEQRSASDMSISSFLKQYFPLSMPDAGEEQKETAKEIARYANGMEIKRKPFTVPGDEASGMHYIAGQKDGIAFFVRTNSTHSYDKGKYTWCEGDLAVAFDERCRMLTIEDVRDNALAAILKNKANIDIKRSITRYRAWRRRNPKADSAEIQNRIYEMFNIIKIGTYRDTYHCRFSSIQKENILPDLGLVTELAAYTAQKLKDIGEGREDDLDRVSTAISRWLLHEAYPDYEFIVKTAEREGRKAGIDAMLAQGEVLGNGQKKLDLTIDPMDGKTYVAKGEKGAITTLTISKEGKLAELQYPYLLTTAYCGKDPAPTIEAPYRTYEAWLREFIPKYAAANGLTPKDLIVTLLDPAEHKRTHHIGILKVLEELKVGKIRKIAHGDTLPKVEAGLKIGYICVGVSAPAVTQVAASMLRGKKDAHLLAMPISDGKKENEKKVNVRKNGIEGSIKQDEELLTIHDMVRSSATRTWATSVIGTSYSFIIPGIRRTGSIHAIYGLERDRNGLSDRTSQYQDAEVYAQERLTFYRKILRYIPFLYIKGSDRLGAVRVLAHPDRDDDPEIARVILREILSGLRKGSASIQIQAADILIESFSKPSGREMNTRLERADREAERIRIALLNLAKKYHAEKYVRHFENALTETGLCRVEEVSTEVSHYKMQVAFSTERLRNIFKIPFKLAKERILYIAELYIQCAEEIINKVAKANEPERDEFTQSRDPQLQGPKARDAEAEPHPDTTLSSLSDAQVVQSTDDAPFRTANAANEISSRAVGRKSAKDEAELNTLFDELERLNEEFQKDIMNDKSVVYLIPSYIMDNSQKTWITYLNKLSQNAHRAEKLHIVDLENVDTHERQERMLERICTFQNDGYQVIAAVEGAEEIDTMLQHNVKALVFKNGTDLYFMLTALRALFRDRFDILVHLYELHTGNRFEGSIPQPDDGEAFTQFIKSLIFSIPDAKRIDYEQELYRRRIKIKALILSA